MNGLPAVLPPDIVEMISTGEGTAVRTATREIARRYRVSQIEALRAVHNALGGVPANARLHELPADVVFFAERPAEHRRYEIEVQHAPLGSSMTDEYRVVEIDTLSGSRTNTVHSDWRAATEQALARYGVHADEWRLLLGQADAAG